MPVEERRDRVRRIEPLTEVAAREAGAACARSRTRDIVDASVVVSAIVRDDLIVTSDGDELEQIAQALGRRVRLHRL